MKQMLIIFVAAVAFVFTVNGQNQTSMNELLSPSATDFSEAKNQGFEVFKLLPRGMFDYEQNELSLRGGGAYYSFTKKSHSYNEIPQIELQQNKLMVGFAGYDYGMIVNLGEIPLSEVDAKNKSVSFLYNYQPKNIKSDVRNEQSKFDNGFETDGLKFISSLEAKVGHTYVLRAINYDQADTLVALKVQSKDADGSLTIFWKPIKNFEKPSIIRDEKAAIKETSLDTKIAAKETSADENIAARVQDALKAKGFSDVTVNLRENMLVLNGTVSKEKMVEAIRIVMDISKKPVKNELAVK